MLSHYWWDYSMQFSCYNKSNENAGNISVYRCIMSPMNLFFTLKSEIGKVRRQQQLIHIYGLANDITVEAFFLSLENPRFCVVWWTKMRIKTKTEKWSSLKRKQLTWQQQRVLRDVKKFYHHKASFSPLSLSLYALSIEWKLLHLNLCCRLGFSHMHSHFCYHFHSELRAQIHSHSQFLSSRRHWQRLFVFFGGFISTQLASSQSSCGIK